MEIADYYKAKRRQSAARKIFWSVSISVISAAAVWGFFWTPYFRIFDVVVEGSGEASAIKTSINKLLLSYTALILPKNNYFLMREEVVTDILRNDGFGLAEVSKKFPSTLLVKFSKRSPWLVYCKDALRTACYYVDREGTLSEKAPDFSGQLLPELKFKNAADIKLGDNILNWQTSSFLRVVFARLDDLEISAEKIEAGDDDEIKITTNESWQLVLSSAFDPEKTFYDLKLLLEQKIGDKRSQLDYIDMRFENKAFYKLH